VPSSIDTSIRYWRMLQSVANDRPSEYQEHRQENIAPRPDHTRVEALEQRSDERHQSDQVNWTPEMVDFIETLRKKYVQDRSVG
jgi:hypothetical protein